MVYRQGLCLLQKLSKLLPIPRRKLVPHSQNIAMIERLVPVAEVLLVVAYDVHAIRAQQQDGTETVHLSAIHVISIS